ncbi:hypothetical protein D3C84_857760 [compost metagenome]
MGRFGVAEGRLFQTDPLADQPTGEAMPDHQQAFSQEVIRVPQRRIVQHQPHSLAFGFQRQARGVGEQTVEQQAALKGLAQGPTVDQRVTHHGKRPGFTRSPAESQVFVPQCQPQCLQQASELLGRNPRARLIQQLGADAELLQQRKIVEALPTRAAQGCAGEVAGDRALAHG